MASLLPIAAFITLTAKDIGHFALKRFLDDQPKRKANQSLRPAGELAISPTWVKFSRRA